MTRDGPIRCRVEPGTDSEGNELALWESAHAPDTLPRNRYGASTYPSAVRRRAVLVAVLVLAGCGTAPRGGSTAPPPPSDIPSTSASASASPPAASASATPAPEPLAWQRLEATGPSAREDHTWTVAGDGRTAFLFGGRDGATVLGDLWAYDLDADAWSELSPGDGPAARFGHEATWVDGIGLVAFAGQAGASFFNDLWAYDPEEDAWRELPATGDVPVARYGTCAALGPDGRLWISHGFTAENARFSDTLAYDFASGAWTDETPDGDKPVERCLHGCWWTDDGALTLYAGQTTGVTALGDSWTLADGAWSQAGGALPPERNLYARARLDAATLVFGGQALDGGYLADLWLLPDSDAAMQLDVEGVAPDGRSGAELVYDADGGRVLLFGGRDADGGLADLWQLDGQPLDG
jgi:hypothetical protein